MSTPTAGHRRAGQDARMLATAPRLLGLLLGLGARAAPARFAAALLAATLGAAAGVCYPVGYHLAVDGVLAGSRPEVVTGSVLVASLFTLAWALAILGSAQSAALTDRVHVCLGQRIARLVNAAPGLDHLERPELLGEIDQLREGRRTLAAGLRQVLSGWQVAIRGLGVAVLLATVYPPALLVPVLAAAPALAARRASRIQHTAEDAVAADRRLADDLFTLATTPAAAGELRTYGLTTAVAARHADLGERIRARSVASAVRGALWESVGAATYAAGFVGVVAVLVVRAAHGHTSPGQVVMAVSLLRRVQRQLSAATDTAGSLAAAVRTARRLLWLQDYVRDRTRATARLSGRLPDRLGQGIRMERVSFGYPGGGQVLHEVDLHLPAGATVAIVGENGAGKTTLALLLAGMYPPGQGRILADGIDLATVAPSDWRARVTGVLQDFLRLYLPLRHCVGVGDPARVDEEDAVRTALARAGADDLLTDLPDGLDTQLGRMFGGGRDLSGGQWQQVALARGLMRERPLLTVLDEPTASLDITAQTAVFARFAGIAAAGSASGAVTVLVSHRLAAVRDADLVVLLDHGRVAEVGSHAELVAAGGGYAELFALQASGYLPGGPPPGPAGRHRG